MADTTTTGTTSTGNTTGTTTTQYTPVETGRTQSLSEWAGPYVTEMLGRGQALASQPYQAYMGPLTAGASPLQQQAFSGIGSLTTPSAMTTAATSAGNIASQMGTQSYSPTTFTNQFTAPQEFQAGTFTNQFQTPTDLYKAQDITTATFTPEYAQQYMNPYLQQALDPQIAEARRQAEIQRMQEAGRLAQAGAYGGSRQAIMESEGARNLLSNLANITGQGYNTAFQQAGQMFTSDQARALQAAQANQAARQAAGQQALTAAQLQAQYGLSADQAREASRQFGAQQGMTAAQQAAQFGQAAQQATEASRQFGAQFGLGALRDQLAATQAQSALARAGLQSDMDIARQQAELGGIQRGIESEGIAADMAQFEQERLDPYKQVQFMQSLLQGMPLQTLSATYSQPTASQSFAGGAAGVMDILNILRQYGIIPPAAAATGG